MFYLFSNHLFHKLNHLFSLIIYKAFQLKDFFENKEAIGFRSVSKSCFANLFSIAFICFFPWSSIIFLCFSKALSKGDK